MTEMMESEIDSGRGSDSVGSDSNSIGSSANSSTSSLLDVDEDPNKTIGLEQRPGLPGMETFELTEPDAPDIVPRTRFNLTTFVQKLFLLTVGWAVMLPHTVKYSWISNPILRKILCWLTRLIPVVMFVLILGGMSGATSQLKPSDHPPQLFDPNSNIQKMLDLTGNLTESKAVNCWKCSAWYLEGGGGGGQWH